MSQYVREVNNQHEWDSIDHQHWVQRFEYGEIQKQQGRTVLRCVVTDENNYLYGYFQLIVYPLIKDTAFAYMPYGPARINKPDASWNSESDQAVRDYLTKTAQSYNLVFTRHEQESLGRRVPLWAYRTSFHQPRGEVVQDLGLCLKESDDDITPVEILYPQLSKSTKRNLKKAGTHDLNYQFYYGKDMISQTEDYIRINQENATAHDTTTHQPEYFRALFSLLASNEDNFVLTVTRENKPVAINIYTLWNQHAFCPFGASTAEGKKLGAYYFIKWIALQELLKRNITLFNWGGVSVGKNDKNLAGLNQFKLGFGGEVVEHDDLYDSVHRVWWYWLYLLRSGIKSFTG